MRGHRAAVGQRLAGPAQRPTSCLGLATSDQRNLACGCGRSGGSEASGASGFAAASKALHEPFAVPAGHRHGHRCAPGRCARAIAATSARVG
jgi:hypothetical protein